jgi:CheY-like chemotaxis protein
MCLRNTPATILCLDDEELPLSLRKLVLESAGYSVFTATNTAQALEVFTANHVDLLIADNVRGVVDFVDRVHEIKPDLPVMFLTGGTALRDNLRPPKYYLHKLEGSAEMIDKVREAISQSHHD